MNYEDYQKMVAKKAAKKAKKAAKKAQKLDGLITKAAPVPPSVPEREEKPQYAPWTDEERATFRRRIDNEKANIWKFCSKNAEEILKHCEMNEADEKNPAVKIARRDARAWAEEQLGINIKAPF